MSGKADFEWALEVANRELPDGKWVLDESDFGFTVGLASDKLRKAVYLRHCGDNMGNVRQNRNDDPNKELWLARTIELMTTEWAETTR